jgi:hypothetical protein
MGDMEHGYWNPDPATDAKRMSLTGGLDPAALKDIPFTKSTTMDSDVMVPMENNPLHQTLR